MNKDIIIIGAGGMSRTIIETAHTLKRNVKSIIDINFNNEEEEINGIKVIGNIDKLELYNKDEIEISIAIGENTIRQEIYNDLKDKNYFFTKIIHPTAIISKKDVALEENIYIGAGTIVMSNVSIGSNSIIYSGCIIEHESKIGSHCFISPGVNIAGKVKVNDLCSIGIGTSIIEKINIKENSIIGAGSVVITDIPSNSKAFGNPAKLKK